MKLLALCVLLLAPPPAAAQLPTWQDGRRFIEQRPVAHALGGAGINLFVRGPWMADRWTNTWWKRQLWVNVGEGVWAYWNVNELHGYHGWYWDLAFANVGSLLLEVLR